jgi:hypothetical protein
MNVIVVGAPIRIVREISESGKTPVHKNARHSIFFADERTPDIQVLPQSAWAQFRCRQVQEHANKSEVASVWMSAPKSPWISPIPESFLRCSFYFKL